MKRKRIFFLMAALFGITALLGPLFFAGGCSKKAAQEAERKEAKKILYWTCAMHPSVHAAKPGKCPICGMELMPVYAEEKPVNGSTSSPSLEPSRALSRDQQTSKPEKEEAYYGCGVKEEGHCPHCDEGKIDAKCICGGHSFAIEGVKDMKCPVCGRELKKLEPEEASKLDTPIVSRVTLKKEQVERAGVVTEPVGKYHLSKTIRTVGRIAFDPELAIAQEEFLTALETQEKVSKSPDVDVINRALDIVNKSKLRLRLLGLSDEQIKELEHSRAAQTNLILPENTAWVYADIYEYDIGWIKEGEDAKVTAVAFPGEEFKGIIKSINPVLDPATRSVKVRIEVGNPERKLKPEMYVDVVIENMYISPEGSHEVLAVPKEAILDTGTRKLIYIDAGDGRFLGKEVKVGPEAAANIGGREVRLYPILNGLAEGELIVTKGNFLIDSQSQLTGGMSVLWGGAEEIKSEGSTPSGEAKPLETKHRH